MGHLATPDDGFDGALADAAQLAHNFGAEASAGTPDQLDTAVTLFGAVEPVSLDASMVGYVGARDKGAGIVGDSQALVPPNLLELPVQPGFASGIVKPPQIFNVDLGTFKLGDPPKIIATYKQRFFDGPQVSGPIDVSLVDGDYTVWQLTYDLTYDHDSTEHSIQEYLYTFTFYPSKVGKFTAQVNVTLPVVQGFQIYTYTATITP
jgi:hypothetical protein